MIIDIVIGLQHGDEGKGKVICDLIKNINKYDLCVRFNGGPNAGHTVYKNNKKIILHQIPCGILYNIPSLISSGCVIDLEKLQEEIKLLKSMNIPVEKLLKIAYNVHIITKENIEQDKKNNKIGTTGSGIGPTYSKKCLRIGKRIENENIDLNCEIVNPIHYMKEYNNILFEGAQGYNLDIDWGDYPYVTSSSCLAANIFLNGVPLQEINKVYGICKIYDTYVGNKKFQSDEIIFNKLQEIGNECGSTTERTRQCNWLNLDSLKNAIYINGVTDLIINKCDIINKLKVYKVWYNNELIEFDDLIDMQDFIIRKIGKNIRITYSYSPYKI